MYQWRNVKRIKLLLTLMISPISPTAPSVSLSTLLQLVVSFPGELSSYVIDSFKNLLINSASLQLLNIKLSFF